MVVLFILSALADELEDIVFCDDLFPEFVVVQEWAVLMELVG